MTFVKSQYNEGQKAFEERCGLSNGQINKMTNGTNTTTLGKIAEVCPQLNLRLFGSRYLPSPPRP